VDRQTPGLARPLKQAARPAAHGTRRAASAGAALACAALLAAGCSGSGPEPAPTPAGTAVPAAAASTRALAASYLAIAQAGNRRLEHDFDGLKGRDRDNLAAARADLRDAAATERLFDRRLLAIAFPPRTERIVRTLFAVNQARARLTDEAAASTSLGQLRAYQRQLDAANGPVEDAVRVIRGQLGLPPPDTG
jgi:hypothetical protein